MSNALTIHERGLIEQIASLGPSILFEHGMDEKAAQTFMERPEVATYLERLAVEVQHQAVLGTLTRFSARRQLSRLVPESVRVLREALAGPAYVIHDVIDTETGESRRQVQRDLLGKPVFSLPEPTSNQLRAAAEVLDRVGVVGTQTKVIERVTPENVADLIHREEIVDSTFAINPDAESHEQQTLSRERVRNVLEVLRKRLPALLDSKDTKRLVQKVARVKLPKKPVKVVSVKKGKAVAKKGLSTDQSA